MNKEELEKEVIANIRACLVSTKGKCDLQQINRDYRLLMGTEIPYKDFKYQSLENFICNIPSLTTSRTNGILYIDAKETEKSAHISALVNRQKTRNRRKVSSSYKPPRHLLTSARSRWQPKTAKKSYQNSPRPVAVNHNQFVNLPQSKPKHTTTIISAQLAARLGPRVPLTKSNSLTSEINEGSSDDIFAKSSKQRLSKRIENLNINNSKSEILTVDNFGIEKNNRIADTSLKYFPSLEEADNIPAPQSAPVSKVGDRLVWPNALHTSSIDSAFIMKSVPKTSDRTFVPTGNHLVDFKNFAATYDLGELHIKVISRKSKPLKRVLYDCHIKVGKHSYSSYPNDFFNEVEAQMEAAKQALEELMPIYNRRKSLLISDEEDILGRIPPIVQSHFYGIWKEQLEADYTETYSEQLPLNWLQIVDTLPNISVTPCLDKFVLRFCKPGEGFQKGLKDSTQFVSNISVPTNTTTFDDNDSLTAEITCPISASEIWCRQINTPESADFDTMSTKLEAYCNQSMNLQHVETIDVGGYYIALAVLEYVWCRVRVFDVTDDSVNCFCIDYGDELVVSRNQLYALPRQFARNQAQAFVCRLVGVEEFYEASKSSEYIEKLSGKTVSVYLQENNSSDDLTHNVLLVDTEDDVVINEQLQKSLEYAMYTAPELTDIPKEVYLTHAEDSGIVYVQIPYFGNRQLESMLSELENSVVKNEIPNLKTKPITRENSKDKLYFLQNKDSNHWYRTKILDWAPSQRNFAQIQYVDYGATDIINVNETVMYPLEDLNDVLTKFSDQAQPARFDLKTIPQDFVKTISRLVPKDQLVLAKVVGFDAGNLPRLKFFMRSEPDNLLFSINDALETTNEVSTNNINGKLQSTKLQRLMMLNQFDDGAKIPSTGLLRCPQLPLMGAYFDVYIPFAVTPFNFFVQPLDSRKQLMAQMRDLQEKYKSIQYSPLSISDIIPGKIYASMYKDQSWYRTSVIKVIHPGSISVFYCDYGYYANLTLQQLYPLDDSFLVLPYQAIKAKLAGIQPKHSKWTAEDCLYFEKLVCNKRFVSVVVGIEKDAFYECDTVLNLKLVDTSTNSDVYVDLTLITTGIAIAQ